jgi:hypothetical protein
MSHQIRDINEIVGFQVESTADWRRRKAEEFPDDKRNLEAAEALDRLAAEIAGLEGSELHQRIDALIDLTEDADVFFRFSESVSESLRSIGFHGGPESGVEFLEWYHDELKDLLTEHINDSDGGVPSPSLAEQVENNEEVRAAKRAYEEAQQKAYAEARKRL